MRTFPSAPRSFAGLWMVLSGTAAAALAIGACANPDTLTPSCDSSNVDQYGIHPSASGCEQLAACDKPNIADCCTDGDGGAFTGNDLAACLHGYGDPSCSYLITTTDGMNVTFTCSATPPGPDGGT